MTSAKTILNTVIGKPNSLTAIAFQTGVVMERERIIKLLESEYGNLDENGVCAYTNHYPEICNCEVIALIKGENK